MKNHPLINPATGQEEWISRAIAVLVFVVARDKNQKLYLLAQVRGPKTPDPEFRGCWCLPCGYLDYNETVKEAAVREVFEETGVKLNPIYLSLWNINDNPTTDKRQNITFRYITYLSTNIEDIELSNKNSEEGETDKVGWIDLRFINDYKWAFNHEALAQQIKEVYSYSQKTTTL